MRNLQNANIVTIKHSQSWEIPLLSTIRSNYTYETMLWYILFVFLKRYYLRKKQALVFFNIQVLSKNIFSLKLLIHQWKSRLRAVQYWKKKKACLIKPKRKKHKSRILRFLGAKFIYMRARKIGKKRKMRTKKTRRKKRTVRKTRKKPKTQRKWIRNCLTFKKTKSFFSTPFLQAYIRFKNLKLFRLNSLKKLIFLTKLIKNLIKLNFFLTKKKKIRNKKYYKQKIISKKVKFRQKNKSKWIKKQFIQPKLLPKKCYWKNIRNNFVKNQKKRYFFQKKLFLKKKKFFLNAKSIYFAYKFKQFKQLNRISKQNQKWWQRRFTRFQKFKNKNYLINKKKNLQSHIIKSTLVKIVPNKKIKSKTNMTFQNSALITICKLTKYLIIRYLSYFFFKKKLLRLKQRKQILFKNLFWAKKINFLKKSKKKVFQFFVKAQSKQGVNYTIFLSKKLILNKKKNFLLLKYLFLKHYVVLFYKNRFRKFLHKIFLKKHYKFIDTINNFKLIFNFSTLVKKKLKKNKKIYILLFFNFLKKRKQRQLIKKTKKNVKKTKKKQLFILKRAKNYKTKKKIKRLKTLFSCKNLNNIRRTFYFSRPKKKRKQLFRPRYINKFKKTWGIIWNWKKIWRKKRKRRYINQKWNTKLRKNLAIKNQLRKKIRKKKVKKKIFKKIYLFFHKKLIQTMQFCLLKKLNFFVRLDIHSAFFFKTKVKNFLKARWRCRRLHLFKLNKKRFTAQKIIWNFYSLLPYKIYNNFFFIFRNLKEIMGTKQKQHCVTRNVLKTKKKKKTQRTYPRFYWGLHNMQRTIERYKRKHKYNLYKFLPFLHNMTPKHLTGFNYRFKGKINSQTRKKIYNLYKRPKVYFDEQYTYYEFWPLRAKIGAFGLFFKGIFCFFKATGS